MKPKALYIQVLLVLLVLIIFINMLSFVFITNNINKDTTERIVDDAYLVLHSLDWAFSPLLEKDQNENIQRLMENVGSASLVKTLKIASSDEVVLFSNNSKTLIKEEIIALEEIIVNNKLQFDMRLESTQELLVSVPIKGQFFNQERGSDVQAALLLLVDNSYEDELISKLKRGYIIEATLTTFVVIFLTAIVLYLLIGKPLKKFEYVLSKISTRDYSKRVHIEHDSEFKDLANVFNKMIEDVAIHTAELDMARNTAEEATRGKTEFMANVSHEILTPINSIIGFADLLEEDEDDNEKRKKLKSIKSASQRLIWIVNDILDITEFELDALHLDNRLFFIRESIMIVKSLYLNDIKEKGLEFEVIIEENVPESVCGDASRFRQVLINLLSNAIKFTNEGFVKANISYDNSYVKIIISDSGIGISNDKLDTIFDLFSQSDNSLSRSYSGIGLGLTICDHIIKAMNGEIRVESSLDEGTTFYLSLFIPELKSTDDLVEKWIDNNPQNKKLIISYLNKLPKLIDDISLLADENDVEGLKEVINMIKGTASNLGMDEICIITNGINDLLIGKMIINNLVRDKLEQLKVLIQNIPIKHLEILSNKEFRVLIVDSDEMHNDIIIKSIFGTNSVDITSTGMSAIEMMYVKSYDLLLINMMIITKSGFEIVERLKEAHHKPYIIAMIGNEDQNMISNYLEKGCDWFISKPISVPLLLEKIKELKTD